MHRAHLTDRRRQPKKLRLAAIARVRRIPSLDINQGSKNVESEFASKKYETLALMASVVVEYRCLTVESWMVVRWTVRCVRVRVCECASV